MCTHFNQKTHTKLYIPLTTKTTIPDVTGRELVLDEKGNNNVCVD